MICKTYGDRPALRNVSLHVEPGKIVGLIGPDGAGKTSLFRIIVTLQRADSGTVLFAGKDITQIIRDVRSRVGYMPERFSLYPDLSVEQNLNFFGELFSISATVRRERINRLYQFSGLQPFASRPAGQLSGGMKQKLALSCILMHEPELLVLDEPSTGVDPISRHEFWQLLHQIAKNGTGILVATPYLDEADQCDHVAIIHEGCLLASDPPEKITASFDAPLFLIRSDRVMDCYEAIQKSPLGANATLFGAGIHLADRSKKGLKQLKQKLDTAHVPYTTIEKLAPCLEDQVLQLILKTGADHA